MEHNNRGFQGFYEDPQPMGNDDFANGEEFFDETYPDAYEEEFGEYENADYNVISDEEEDYPVYNEELDNSHRFHMAMNVFDSASVLAGVVVIFALTALIISLISWLREDITHMFVFFQSGIQ